MDPGGAMRIRRGLAESEPGNAGCVVAIGNFDGLHLGHKAILAVLTERGREAGLPAAVLTFEPHPREFFSPAQAPVRLMRLGDKARMLARMGIGELRVLHFGAALAGWDADTFIERVLERAMGAKRVVIGEGFRFGRGRSGDVASLRRAGDARGFAVDEVAPLRQGGEVVSSTRVRGALAAGQLDEAAAMLGRAFAMGGRVVAGLALGRQLGMPTANIRLHRRVPPVAGVFAVRVSGAGLERRPGVAAVGTRPTLGGTEWLLEAHVLDFDGDLYRRRLEVEFVARLRGEICFPDLAALAEQMKQDAREARQLLDG